MNFVPHDNFASGEGPSALVPSEIIDAVRAILHWVSDDPDRGGLIGTLERFARAWREYCGGYRDDPAAHLSRTFCEVGGYDEIMGH